MQTRLSRHIAASPLASVAALPLRLGAVARYDFSVFDASARWLVQSREHTNYTYDLTALNLEHLAWFVAELTAQPVAKIRTYIAEINNDSQLKAHVRARTLTSKRRRLADSEVRLSRRAGWYAIIRAVKPSHVVETGTDKGLGSCAMAAALLRNGHGVLTTIDINPDSGYLIAGDYAGVTERVIGDSVQVLQKGVMTIDLFLHDSLHTRAYEIAEFEAVAPQLSGRAVVLSDNAHVTDALPTWAERTGRSFAFFCERPAHHWYPGDGIGAAYSRGESTTPWP
jgi:predicted O-methyltransferase YrrM